MDQWWGSASRAKAIRRADAFLTPRPRQRHRHAIPQLLAIATDSAEGPFPRANALGYLSRFGSDPRVFPVFEWALGDPQTLPRIIAALRMPTASAKQAAIADLTKALRDPIATVRLSAAVSLVAAGVRDVPAEARALYAARAQLNSDDAAQQFAAGRFFLLTGDPAHATQYLAGSLKMDPETPAQYFLAYALAQQGKYADARAIAEKIPTSDPQYDNAQGSPLENAIANR